MSSAVRGATRDGSSFSTLSRRTVTGRSLLLPLLMHEHPLVLRTRGCPGSPKGQGFRDTVAALPRNVFRFGMPRRDRTGDRLIQGQSLYH